MLLSSKQFFSCVKQIKLVFLYMELPQTVLEENIQQSPLFIPESLLQLGLKYLQQCSARKVTRKWNAVLDFLRGRGLNSKISKEQLQHKIKYYHRRYGSSGNEVDSFLVNDL
jgi:hypothetical protein